MRSASFGILRAVEWQCRTAWPLKMGPIGCSETSVRNYHSYCTAWTLNIGSIGCSETSVRNYHSFCTAWTLKIGSIGCSETSVRIYHYTLRKIPKQCWSHVPSPTWVQQAYGCSVTRPRVHKVKRKVHPITLLLAVKKALFAQNALKKVPEKYSWF
jgi:hypothetical protein